MSNTKKEYATIHRVHFLNEDEYKAVNRYIEITCSYLNLFTKEDTKILDVGASDGEMSKYLKGDYHGVDIEPADEKIEQGDIFTVNGQYDLIIFNHTLEHMENTHNILKEVRTKLNENGLLFINVPIGEWAYDIEGHIVLFNQEILERLLTNYGFKIVEVSTHCFRDNKVELWVMSQKL